jgi:hypothetical protein
VAGAGVGRVDTCRSLRPSPAGGGNDAQYLLHDSADRRTVNKYTFQEI